MLLDNKVAIVSGAGRAKGIGQATAAKFAEQGAMVAVADLVRADHSGEDRAALESVADGLRAMGAKALALGVDVTDRRQIDRCVEKTINEFGRIDILVNNAGTAIGAGPFLEQTEQQWDLSYQVNMKGTFQFCQAVIPHMQRSGGGAIVNNASVLGIAAEPFVAAYAASKFGVVGLTKVIAAEFGQDNIRCNAVCPGSVKTQMADESIAKLAEWAGTSIEEAWKEAERCALGRSAEPEEVADAILYLACPMSSYVSGTTLIVSGAAYPGL